jgi:xanthine dehydrogenase YagR molybdenum-binding subunit
MTTAVIGQPIARVDGPLKVTGGAQYAAEFNQPNQTYGVIVGSTVGLGRITGIDVAPVLRLPGVLAVFSHLNAPKLVYAPHKSVIDPADGERLHVLQDDRVRFFGQPVALVVADTLDRAERAAAALRVTYAAEPLVADIHDPKAPQVIALVTAQPGFRLAADRVRGTPDTVLAASPARVDAIFEIARENHNPMEPHATIAVWFGERLTLWSKSQYVSNEKAEVAAIFAIPPDNVRVICPFVGGGFGTSLRTWPHVTLAALAARALSRPVKVVLTRRQMFHTTGHRPRTSQHIALGATADGKLTAIFHEGFAETSRYETYIESFTGQSEFLYACPHVRTRYRVVPTDTATPTSMRAPGEATGMHALECAMDELAVALDIDPIELRRRNEPDHDESAQKPFSSRSLLRCLEAGAARFGWERRDRRPGSMRDGRLLIGWGVAASTRSAAQAPCDARAPAGRRHGGGRGRRLGHGSGNLHLDDTGCRGHARPAGGSRAV